MTHQEEHSLASNPLNGPLKNDHEDHLKLIIKIIQEQRFLNICLLNSPLLKFIEDQDFHVFLHKGPHDGRMAFDLLIKARPRNSFPTSSIFIEEPK